MPASPTTRLSERPAPSGTRSTARTSGRTSCRLASARTWSSSRVPTIGSTRSGCVSCDTGFTITTTMATTTITIARTGREWGHRRRMRTGLIAHDAARAQPGYTLFAPMYGDGTVYLVDMHGKVVHTWRLPYRPGLHGHLLANGHLLYGGKIMDDLERFEGWRRFKGGAVLEVDWTPQRQRPSAGHRGERDDVRRLRRRDDDGRRRRI